MLQLTNIRKTYHRQLILDVPAFTLDKGLYWIKGANGSGKTTLLKMIAGLIPFEGNISFNGISLKDKPHAYRRQVSWAAADPVFPAFMRAIDLVRLYQHIRKVPAEEVDLLL